jgi:hypothetical protein
MKTINSDRLTGDAVNLRPSKWEELHATQSYCCFACQTFPTSDMFHRYTDFLYHVPHISMLVWLRVLSNWNVKLYLVTRYTKLADVLWFVWAGTGWEFSSVNDTALYHNHQDVEVIVTRRAVRFTRTYERRLKLSADIEGSVKLIAHPATGYDPEPVPLISH